MDQGQVLAVAGLARALAAYRDAVQPGDLLATVRVLEWEAQRVVDCCGGGSGG